MADEVLMRVPLNLKSRTLASQGKSREELGNSSAETAMDIQIENGDLPGTLKDLNVTCYEYQREPVRRMICRVSFFHLNGPWPTEINFHLKLTSSFLDSRSKTNEAK